MSTWKLLVAIVLIFVLGVILGKVDARAEDRGAWFRSLKMPGSGTSCCDISDCKQTQAKYQDGWWAVVRGTVRFIPDEIILRNKRSIDGEAYVCASNSGPPETATLYCFIEPTMGY